MAIVKFPWDAQLVSLRREVCPRARWEKASRAWFMTDPDAETFLQAAQRRMGLARVACPISVDDETWVVGFAEGTPCQLDPGPTTPSDRTAALTKIRSR